MKTTLDLPDDLLRDIKIKAAREGRKLKDAITELLRLGLVRGPEQPGELRHRVALPLVHCRHEARPDEEMTPGRVAALLAEEEAESNRGAVR